MCLFVIGLEETYCNSDLLGFRTVKIKGYKLEDPVVVWGVSPSHKKGIVIVNSFYYSFQVKVDFRSNF